MHVISKSAFCVNIQLRIILMNNEGMTDESHIPARFYTEKTLLHLYSSNLCKIL